MLLSKLIKSVYCVPRQCTKISHCKMRLFKTIWLLRSRRLHHLHNMIEISANDSRKYGKASIKKHCTETRQRILVKLKLFSSDNRQRMKRWRYIISRALPKCEELLGNNWSIQSINHLHRSLIPTRSHQHLGISFTQ